MYVFDLEVKELKEFVVFSTNEEDPTPVYSHMKLAFGQRRSYKQEAKVSEGGD